MKARSMTDVHERISNAREPVAATAGDVLHRIQDRLADPCLNSRERWALGQFAQFLGGSAPEPDRRDERISDPQHLT